MSFNFDNISNTPESICDIDPPDVFVLFYFNDISEKVSPDFIKHLHKLHGCYNIKEGIKKNISTYHVSCYLKTLSFRHLLNILYDLDELSIKLQKSFNVPNDTKIQYTIVRNCMSNHKFPQLNVSDIKCNYAINFDLCNFDVVNRNNNGIKNCKTY